MIKIQRERLIFTAFRLENRLESFLVLGLTAHPVLVQSVGNCLALTDEAFSVLTVQSYGLSLDQCVTVGEIILDGDGDTANHIIYHFDGAYVYHCKAIDLVTSKERGNCIHSILCTGLMIQAHGVCQGNLAFCGIYVRTVICKAFHRSHGVPVDGEKLAGVCASVADKHKQHVALTGTVVFLDLGYLIRRINSGEKVSLKIPFRNIGNTFISDLVSILCGRGCTPVHSMAVGRSENTCS